MAFTQNTHSHVLTTEYTPADGSSKIWTASPSNGRFTMINMPDVKLGAHNPDYRTMIAQGADATTNYIRKGLIMGAAGGGFNDMDIHEYYGRLDGLKTRGSWSGSPFPINVADEGDVSTRNLANTRFKQRLTTNTGSFNASVPLAQIGDLKAAVLYAAQFSSKFVGTLLALKRLHLRDAAKRASDLWLGYSFGINPLLNDISDTAEAVSAFLDRKPAKDHVVGKASSPVTLTQWLGAANGSDNTALWCQLYGAGEVSYKYGGAFALDINSSNDYTLAQHLQLTYSSLPSVGWELIPFSWLIDTFTNVGDVLEDTFWSPPGDTLYMYENYRYKLKGNITVYPHPFVGSYKNVISTDTSPVVVPFEYFSFARTKLASLPRRSLSLNTTDTIGSHAVTKLLNLTALLLK